MALDKYTYIAGLGQTCATGYQIGRAISANGFDASNAIGPFDAVAANANQIATVVRSGFREYLDPRFFQFEERDNDSRPHWRVRDRFGVQSWHQLRRRTGEKEPCADEYFRLGRWLGSRIQKWTQCVRSPQERILFVRNESAAAPDTEGDIGALLTVLEAEVRGTFCLAWVRFSSVPVDVEHSKLRVFHVRRMWPPEVPEDEVEFLKDYGQGVAWRGHDADWDQVWRGL